MAKIYADPASYTEKPILNDDDRFLIADNETSETKFSTIKAIKDSLNFVDYSNYGFVSPKISLVKGGLSIFHIDNPVKAGKIIRLTVSNYTVTGSGSYNVSLRDKNNNVLAVKYGNSNQSLSVVIAQDADGVRVQLGSDATITAQSADVEVFYDKEEIPQTTANTSAIAENTSEIDAHSTLIAQNTAEIEKAKNVLDSKELQFINYVTTDNVSDYIYGSPVYYGYNKPVANDSLIKYIRLMLFGVTSAHIGETRDFVVGTIDQRNWLLPRITIKGKIVSVVSNNAVFEFKGKEIVRAGEVVFVVGEPFGSNANLGLTASTYDPNNQLYRSSSLAAEVVPYIDKNARVFEVFLVEYNTIFAVKEDFNDIDSKIETVQNETSKINKYTDSITGGLYEIKIANGQIVLQSLDFTNILVIGHSFVSYGNSPDADWHLDAGENRAMAPSIFANQWTNLMGEKFGAAITKISGVDFERNYSTSYDFAGIWNVQNNYDAICVYLSENAVYSLSMQASWVAMLNYLKQAAPNAKVFCTASWTTNNKLQAIQAACNSVLDVTYVDMVGLNVDANKWKKGDYYLGKDSLYYPMGAAFGHPNDKGHFEIANRFLSYMGHNNIVGKVYSVILNQSAGGAIETPNPAWVEAGIVTIRIMPSSGYILNSLTVVDDTAQPVAVTLRTNAFLDGTNRDYYTFTMPSKNVTVTPVFILE